MEFAGQAEERWKGFTDNHHFVPFLAPLSALPEIIYPQNEWLEFLPGPYAAASKGIEVTGVSHPSAGHLGSNRK